MNIQFCPPHLQTLLDLPPSSTSWPTVSFLYIFIRSVLGKVLGRGEIREEGWRDIHRTSCEPLPTSSAAYRAYKINIAVFSHPSLPLRMCIIFKREEKCAMFRFSLYGGGWEKGTLGKKIPCQLSETRFPCTRARVDSLKLLLFICEKSAGGEKVASFRLPFAQHSRREIRRRNTSLSFFSFVCLFA